MKALLPNLVLLLFFYSPLLAVVHSNDEENPHVEVITKSSPCSVTCGLGVKEQTLCVMKTANGERDRRKCSSGGGPTNLTLTTSWKLLGGIKLMIHGVAAFCYFVFTDTCFSVFILIGLFKTFKRPLSFSLLLFFQSRTMSLASAHR